MALTIRKRGAVYHARGTVRVGKTVVPVAEFSTGQGARADALAVAEAEERRIREEVLEGDRGRARRLTMADAFAAYLQRPGGLQSWDVARIGALNEAMGHRPLTEARAAWQAWLADHARQEPSTLARTRSALQAALRHGAAMHGVEAPTLPGVRQRRDAGRRVPFLPTEDSERLLRAYNPHAACPVLLLAELGLRTQEVLRLDWRDVSCEREELHIRAEGTKSGRGRAVPMTRRVALLLWGMWEAAGRPARGTVFLSSRGEPYADTRGHDGKRQGGNPLARAHATACRAAGVTRFRVHDWRHHWAAHHVMGGMDLFTLMRLGGWSSLRMVQDRYGAVSAAHVRQAVRKRA